MIDESELKLIIKKCENNIINNKLNKTTNYLLNTYKEYPSEIKFIHLLVSCCILSDEINNLLKVLQSEERISLFSSKINYIKNIIINSTELTLFTIGSALTNRGWNEDAKIYFRLHSTLNPDHDKSLIPLAEDAIKSGNLNKGIALFNSAASNYFNKKHKGVF